MKTIYKNSSRIAAAIVASVVVSTGAAFAVTRDAVPAASVAEADHVGRFIVTPTSMKHVAPAAIVGRFVVSRHTTEYVPATTA